MREQQFEGQSTDSVWSGPVSSYFAATRVPILVVLTMPLLDTIPVPRGQSSPPVAVCEVCHVRKH